MYKIFFIFLFVVSLNATLVDGVAIVVKGSAITLLDIKKEMRSSGVDEKRAQNTLIRKKLEELEMKSRKISVNSEEVYEDLKKTADRNKMSVSDFYDAVRNANGLTSSELKAKVRERLLSQKLYSAIAYSSVSLPSEVEIKEYYELHESEFIHPSGFKVVIYVSKDSSRLQAKIENPMFYAPDIHTSEQTLEYEKISPELAGLLSKTPQNSFTPVLPNGKGGFMSFYIKEVEESMELGLESVKNQIINRIMAAKREQILGDYFARLRQNADIKILRQP